MQRLVQFTEKKEAEMKFFHWLKRSQGKILATGWRLVLFEAFNFFFNYPLYGWVMSSQGLVQGWLIMMAVSLALCVGLFWYYDRAGVDWLFANAARDWEENTTQLSGWLRKIIVRISKSRDTGLAGIPIFVLASINLDPVIVAAHYKKSHFDGIGLRDWGILIASVVIGNLWWGLRIGLIVEILKWLAGHF